MHRRLTLSQVKLLFLILCIAASLSAQDVGMGTRRGSGARLEAPYTLDIETPHVKWANPLPGGPIRLLAVPTVDEGRTVVELAQRLSLDLTTVSIDPAWDVNKWTMSFGRDYGVRAERGDLRLIYFYLEQELTSTKSFDAILLPLHHGWNSLTPASREALIRRVREGCGLVLIQPLDAEISPLVPATPIVLPKDPDNPVRLGNGDKSPWKRTGQHYVTRAIPVETFPFEFLESNSYKAAPGAEVLIQTTAGTPVAAVHMVGKGRVVSFGYRNAGISWHMPVEARIHPVDVYWEYFYSMLCRALIFAARREPAAPPDWEHAANTTWQVRDEFQEVRRSGNGVPPKFSDLPPGRFFLERRSATDWEIAAIDVPQRDKIDNVKVSPDVLAEGKPAAITWTSSKPAQVELLDAFGRVIGRASGQQQVNLVVGRPLTHSGVVQVTVGTAVQRVPVLFAASSRAWTDYEVVLPWHGPRSYQPWTPVVDEQFRKLGITTLSKPDRNFRIMASAHLPAFGIYWYRRENYLKRKAEFIKTGDKKYITRDVSLQKPDFDREMRRQLADGLKEMIPLKPFAYYLADESSLTAYADAYDVDWSPEALAGFRSWLQREYPSLEALNASWNTSFTNWNAVLPMTTEEAQKHGNFAPWSDHRVYMEQEFLNTFRKGKEFLHELDPEGLASISGTQVPTPHNGCNWFEIDQVLDYLQPYSGGNQDAMHFLFRPGLLLTGFTGYGVTGKGAHLEQWRRLFYGHTGASIFWHYTLMNPDLTFSSQGKALSEAFGRIQSGIGRLFMNSTVHEDGVAIHFSMASIRGAWITDGKITDGMGYAQRTSKNFAELTKRRNEWVKALEKQGVQFRFLATPQVEGGSLKQFRVLILPYSIALSDREIAEIDAFVKRGGTVYLDDQAGRMDERCRWRKDPIWQGEARGFIRRGPENVEIPPSFPAAGEFLRTIRDLGQSRLIGLLPKEAVQVELPATQAVRYDLIHGGIAATKLAISLEEPAILVERSTRITKLSLDKQLRVSLVDERGSPVDRSVVRLQVFDPSGRLVRYYSSNVTVIDGRAEFAISFALNDAKGNWKVQARDVISGLTAEQMVRR